MNDQPLPNLSRLTPWLQAFPRTFCQPAKHQLSLQAPLKRNVPLRRGLLVGQGVVVLQVAAEAFGLESCPHHVLVHGRGVLGPWREPVSVLWECGLELLDGFGGFVE